MVTLLNLILYFWSVVLPSYLAHNTILRLFSSYILKNNPDSADFIENIQTIALKLHIGIKVLILISSFCFIAHRVAAKRKYLLLIEPSKLMK